MNVSQTPPRRDGFRSALLWLLAGVLSTVLRVEAADVAHLDLHVTIDPDRRVLAVKGSMLVPGRVGESLVLNGESVVHRFTINGKPLIAQRTEIGRTPVLRWTMASSSNVPVRSEFEYTLPLAQLDSTLDHRTVLGANIAATAPAGTFVPASTLWHPKRFDGPATYRIAIAVPGGTRAVVPGRRVDEVITDAGYRVVFESKRPLPGIDLMAGPYEVAERHVVLAGQRRVDVRTYFHRELLDLAPGYLDAAARYIERYDRLIGPYAHPAYSIVSSPLPTGFGMPGIAYLGRQVLRLPFIRSTSLGHEVLHDWWGNGVYPDYANGNWSEGLTTFMADYAFREAESAHSARLMREGWLRDYASVPPDQDRPLRSFVSRRHGADQAVGYNKTAFVFFMLRDQINEQAFLEGLRTFWRRREGTTASWDDLRATFEQASGTELGFFFEQWVQRSGAPSIHIDGARNIARKGERARIEVRLRQSAPAYRLRIPLRIELEGGRSVDVAVEANDLSQRVVLDVPGRARFVVMDPEARVFRRVDLAETAPILRTVMLDPQTRVVLGADPEGRTAALKLAASIVEQGARAAQISDIEPRTPVLVAALAPEVPSLLDRLGLPDLPEAMKGSVAAFAYAGRSQGREFAVVSAPDPASMLALTRSLPHLGGQSYALFEGGRSVQRGVWPAATRRVPVED